MKETLPAQPGNVIANVLVIAVWFGLVTGLVEGVGFMVLQKFHWLNQNMVLRDVSIEIVWISAAVDLILFVIIGLAMIATSRFFPRWVTIYSVFVFAFATFLDWLVMVFLERLYSYAILSLAIALAVVFTRWFRRREAAVLLFWRRSLRWVAAVAVLALVGIEGGLWLQEKLAITNLPVATPNSKNILVIVVDTLRADHLSSHGYGRPTSPNLDRLTQQGVLFENAFATSSWTKPSHASLLTGRFPYEHGAEWDNPRALFNSHYPTLAEVLLSRGYQTAAFSGNQFWFTRPMGFGRGFIRFEDYFHCVGDMVLRTIYGRITERVVLNRLGVEDIPFRKRAPDINNSLLHWIDRHQGRPFFVFVNYMDTHDPYLPPQPYRRKFSSTENPGGILNWRVGRYLPEMTPEQLQGEIDAYDGAIAYVDDHIGQLLSEFHNRGLMESTLIVITSDHGEGFGEHGLFLHANALYREMVQVPLIFHLPGQVPEGVRVAQPVTNAALPATVMDLIGSPDQTVFPGPSLARLWVDPRVDPAWPSALVEIAQQPWGLKEFPARHGSMRSLVSPQWHYIMHEKLGAELYDMRNDTREVHNLAERPQMIDVLEKFQLQLPKALGNAEQ